MSTQSSDPTGKIPSAGVSERRVKELCDIAQLAV